jgi:hypothetical protein
MPTPKKTTTKETAAVTPVRAAKPKVVKTSPVVEVAPGNSKSEPRVKSVKHSKATPAVVVETAVVETTAISAHDQIAKIAYSYWEARGFQPGSPERDWLRAEQEYLQLA